MILQTHILTHSFSLLMYRNGVYYNSMEMTTYVNIGHSFSVFLNHGIILYCISMVTMN